MSSIDIRYAKKNDVPRIMKFINEYWKKDHIMSRDEKLFLFQHEWDKEISFVIAENNRQICGVLGYIPYNAVDRDVTLAIWKALKTEDPMLGIHILEYLRNDVNTRSISAPGINKNTRPAYEFLGIHTGLMRHWYRLNKKESYRIAKIKNDIISKYSVNDEAKFMKFSSYENLEKKFSIGECLVREHKPYKSEDYIKRRYFYHPSFQYEIYGCEANAKKMLLIFRFQSYDHAKVLRLIDCIVDHELIKYSTPLLERLMVVYDCEYMDCYETGVSEEIFRSGGWSLTSETGNIIPEYFSPFEQRNIDIFYMSEIDDVILFKGDGDMDRPN